MNSTAGDLSPRIVARPSSVGTAALAALLTVLSYLGWLGWDQHKYRVPGTTRVEGPYEPWQVVGLAVTLAAVAAALAWRRMSVAATLTITVVLTLAWSVDAATETSQDANLWPVGAVFLAVGTMAGMVVVCALSEGLRTLISRRRPHGAQG